MRSNEENVNIKECLHLNFTILTIFGVWMPSQYRNSWKEYAYKVYSICVLGFTFYTFILSEIINIILVFGDIEKTVEASFLMLTHAAQAVKTFNTLNQYDRIHKLMTTLDDPVFNHVDIKSLHHVRVCMLHVKITTIVLLSLCGLTVVLWAIFPFLESAYEPKLPLLAWYPFEINTSYRFQIVYLYQIVSTLINAICNASQDTIVFGVISLACGQLDILYDKLADKHQRLYHTFEINSRNGNKYYNLSLNTERRKHLVDCVEHHSTIISFIKESQQLFGFMVLSQFCASCIIICMTAFKLSRLPVSVELFSMVLYMTCMLFEVFLYCYSGNDVMIKSERIIDAAYECPWYEYSLEERKLILLIMERSRRPLSITAGIFSLSLATFTSILRSSYSYFAVLQAGVEHE